MLLFQLDATPSYQDKWESVQLRLSDFRSGLKGLNKYLNSLMVRIDIQSFVTNACHQISNGKLFLLAKHFPK